MSDEWFRFEEDDEYDQDVDGFIPEMMDEFVNTEAFEKLTDEIANKIMAMLSGIRSPGKEQYEPEEWNDDQLLPLLKMMAWRAKAKRKINEEGGTQVLAVYKVLTKILKGEGLKINYGFNNDMGIPSGIITASGDSIYIDNPAFFSAVLRVASAVDFQTKTDGSVMINIAFNEISDIVNSEKGAE